MHRKKRTCFHFNTKIQQFLNTILEVIMNGFEIRKLKDISKHGLSGIYQNMKVPQFLPQFGKKQSSANQISKTL